MQETIDYQLQTYTIEVLQKAGKKDVNKGKRNGKLKGKKKTKKMPDMKEIEL